MQLILTGVSGSGKTTVMEGLCNTYPNQYATPLQYTTRPPRGDKEKDQYVFLNTSQFMKKLINGDFIEYIEYNKNLYAIGKFFDKKKTNVFIVDPVGRESLKKYFKLNDIPFVSVYITCDTESIKRRLELRGSSIIEIDKRMEDLKYFYPGNDDDVVDGDYKPHAVLRDVHKIVQGALKPTWH